ncbi:site-specific DNA-methyltransferase [Aggregatibacter actinomycetemcomitans]|uniref:site-specific DNA-methyltransferase n=1 Tax=Aggregatibacter actinomycetemcomitans TaxID=714 RepID=UPI0002400677|nr:site-specific DNA-methyltransferase [Aggregatibacter actinomycetemcomitans]EHK89715.1 adenine specific DNA methylase Mod [Aggregatibacter actinomycetemcomitans RhAA1]KNE76816.1 DNA methylase N-4 [Aggregatibacter actinomycetemcomitans RhAA1]MBN6079957.1 site-specific DNA-methyltransferase [Aggregatibacter actinomycetemcomitans]
MTKQKLELTWIGKHKRPKLETRILLEDAQKSYHAKVRSENDVFDNRLIFGDNLLALKALEQEFAGKVKCVFIDPPYNTGSAFTHYDDGLEHSIWLGLMRDRLEIIKRLLSDDGSLWITIDDNEAHYLKVLCDEVFGRRNFVGNIVWQHSIQGKNDAKLLSLHHNYVLVYRKSDLFVRKLLPRTEEHNTNYKNPDNDPRGAWRSGDVRSPNYRENLRYIVKTPSGKEIPPPPNGWRWSEETFHEKVKTGEISFLDNETRILRKIYLADQAGRVPESIWFGKEAGTTRDASNHLVSIIQGVSFDTPKPEQLIERVLQIATNPGDLVLDSFAGSGTTGAVAHKMGRRWIMVELGEHCHTHIIPRLQKVIDGEDQGGISKAVNWQGGGGFRYFRLAPTLIVNDKWGNQIINPDYNPEMLAEALAKLEGFTYMPSENLWWQHGYSSENDFIYVTTQTLTAEQLQALSEEVGASRSLLICCSAWRGITAEKAAERFPNLSLKKIPKMILARCEWGHDDYSLNVANLPMAEAEPEENPMPSENKPAAKTKAKKAKSAVENQGGLFDGEGD